MKTLKSHEIAMLVGLLNQGRLPEAEYNARILLNSHPNAGMLWKLLGVTLARQGKDALDAFRRAAELMPNDAEAHGNLGALLHDRGRWSEALASLSRTLEIEPHNVDALVYGGNTLKELGRVSEALPLYQRALHHNPRLIEAQNNLGNALLQLGRHDDAIACYRRALEISLDDPQVLCNLGNAQRQRGLLEEALATTQRAIARDPTLSVAHNNLGLILAASGRREQAAASYRHALRLSPNYLDALINLGNVLRDFGMRPEALAVYGRALEVDPNRAESHCNIGSVLFEVRRFEAAIASFRRALALRPDYAPAQFGLGGALRLQRRTAEAQAACAAALAIDPDYPEALALLGELRADEGRFAEAEPLFQRAVTVKPEFAFGLASIAANRKMSRDDAAWLQSAENLLAQHPPLADEINLRFALGKYFDDIHEYERAFGQYAQANELTKRFGGQYSRDSLTSRIDGIMQRCDADFLTQQRTFASRSELPIFIIGMPRSGTSLTEQILASHPAVVGAGELTYWDGAFAAFQEALLTGKSDAELMPDLAAKYLERLSALSGAAVRVVDKMPANFLYAGLIHAVLPRARIIHMQRHPIDTCLSVYFQNFPNMGPYANDLDNLAFYYEQYLRIMAHWRAVLPAATLLDVPYEGLIEDQEGWTRRLLDFVGLPWDPQCLEFHRTERVVVTASKWQVRQKLTASSAGRWKHYQQFIQPLQRLACASAGSKSATDSTATSAPARSSR
jgi:tetratricopeptide (TPR) repeat protein